MENSAVRDVIPGFTTDQALAAFAVGMLDEASVNDWVLQRLHPNGARCPHCRVALSDRGAETFRAGGRLCCKACRKWFTNTTNTILHGSQLNFRQLYLVAALTALANSAGARPSRAREIIARILKLHPDTVADWQENFRALEAAGV